MHNSPVKVQIVNKAMLNMTKTAPLRIRKPQKRRENTEERLLDALETVMQRDGLTNIGVNAVIEESGVTKPLLYRYFGNLEGLIRAWGERRRIWPNNFTPAAETGDSYDAYFDSLKYIAEHLRKHPAALELLAFDLKPDTAFSGILTELKQQAAEQIQPQSTMIEQDTLRFNLTFYSAIVYLSLRARYSPNLMGIQLNTESGWKTAMSMIESIMSDIKLAAVVKKAASKE
jgi:AcrR family transcriptional regulator